MIQCKSFHLYAQWRAVLQGADFQVSPVGCGFMRRILLLYSLLTGVGSVYGACAVIQPAA